MAGIILNRNRQVPAEETPAFGGIAERFRRAGDLDRAIALCREGLKRFPDQLSARVTLGWSFLDKGQYDAARFELEQVLRKAPDNLAAIRGLAELHDRTEGALPPEDERSWRSEGPVGTEVADARPVEIDPEPDPTAAAQADAPLHVTLGHRAPEILHTAAHAEMAAEAAASVHVPLSLGVAPVELEGPADASMAAAANEPASFFVVDPPQKFSLGAGDAVDTAPAPFEVLGPNDRESSELADVASLIGHGLDADADAAVPAVTFDAGFIDAGGLPDAGQITTDTGDDDATLEDWATLAALAAEADAAAEAANARAWHEAEADAVIELAATEAHALENLAVVEGDQIVIPESLDDIDELAGQDIADAIKALEDAARRVEARFSIRPALDRPAASNEEIAAFDFGRIEDTQTGSEDAPIGGPVDTSRDGSFELVAPDLADLAFSDTVGSGGAIDSDELVAAPGTLEPAFDFEGAPEVADADPDTYDVDLQAGQIVADDEPTAPILEQPPQADLDDVAQAPAATEADLLLASIEAGIASPVDVDDVIGSLSIATGAPEPDADATPIDLLGSMALHPAPFETTEAAAGLSVGDTCNDHVSEDVPAGVRQETAEEAVNEDVAEDVVDEVAQEVAEVTEEEVWSAEAASVIVFTEAEAEADGEVGVEVEESQLAPESAEAVAEALGSAELEEPIEAVAPELITSDEVADSLYSEDAADSGDAEIREAVSEVGEPAADFDDPGLGPVAEVETGAEVAEPSREPTADLESLESEVESETSDSDSYSDSDDHTLDDDLALAALVATELPTGPASWHVADVAAAASAPWLEPAVVAAAPVTAVYDAPVFSPLTATITAEVAALAGPFERAASLTPLVGHVTTSTRSTLNRLERFLRQVQARQLELRGETVA